MWEWAGLIIIVAVVLIIYVAISQCGQPEREREGMTAEEWERLDAQVERIIEAVSNIHKP